MLGGQQRSTSKSAQRLVLAVLLALVALAAPLAFADDAPPPPPPPAAEPAASANPLATAADLLSDQAKTAYKEKKYAEAFGLFEKAYAVEARPAFIFNMAKCKEKLAEYAEAVNLLERYLQAYRTANGGLEPGDAADVNSQIRDLKRRAFEAQPEVSIQSSPPGAQVIEAGVTLGSTPLQTHMQPGRHKIVLKLDKHSDLDAEIEVPVSGKVAVVLSLKSSVRRGALAFGCNVRGAQIVVDGKVVAVTPFTGQIEVDPGQHQVTLTKANYLTRDLQVQVSENTLVTVRLLLKNTASGTTWRSYLGYPIGILGIASAVVGGVAAYAANQEYRGTPWFNQLVDYQNWGYRAGGGALGVGVALLVWDGLRDNILAEDVLAGGIADEGNAVTPLGAPKVGP